MKYIWSPWRMKYILRHEHSSDCIFCKAVKSSDDEKNLVVYRGRYSFVILNRYPYTSGHLMVVPYAHESSLTSIAPEVLHEVIDLARHAECVMRKVYHPEGLNLGINIGEAAGAGIASHVHFHVVPRWNGDSNFMTSLAETRVLPESLSETYRKLREAWNR